MPLCRGDQDPLLHFRWFQDWDGPSTYNSDEFLTLRQNDRVRVAEVSPLGAWLRGTVVGSSRSGWFGGPGSLGQKWVRWICSDFLKCVCKAACQLRKKMVG